MRGLEETKVNHHPLTKEAITKALDTKTSGVYRIFIGSLRSKSYIGSSKSIRSRLHAHRRKLEKGTHKNRFLQGLWGKFKNEFRFEVVLECDEQTAREREQLIIDFKSANLYNHDLKVYNYKSKYRRK